MPYKKILIPITNEFVIRRKPSDNPFIDLNNFGTGIWEFHNSTRTITESADPYQRYYNLMGANSATLRVVYAGTCNLSEYYMEFIAMKNVEVEYPDGSIRKDPFPAPMCNVFLDGSGARSVEYAPDDPTWGELFGGFKGNVNVSTSGKFTEITMTIGTVGDTDIILYVMSPYNDYQPGFKSGLFWVYEFELTPAPNSMSGSGILPRPLMSFTGEIDNTVFLPSEEGEHLIGNEYKFEPWKRYES